MSAFLCSDLHIATVAKHVGDYFQCDIQDLANILKRINIRSVNYRYSANARITKCSIKQIRENCNNADIKVLIDCLNYQSCEDGKSAEFKMASTLLDLWIIENPARNAIASIQWDI